MTPVMPQFMTIEDRHKLAASMGLPENAFDGLPFVESLAELNRDGNVRTLRELKAIKK